jgi:hypothetical protein
MHPVARNINFYDETEGNLFRGEFRSYGTKDKWKLIRKTRKEKPHLQPARKGHNIKMYTKAMSDSRTRLTVFLQKKWKFLRS